MLCKKFVLIITALLAAVGLYAEEYVLVKDNTPQAEIVLPVKPTRSAQLAAFELQGHIKAMTGATLPIVKEDTNSSLYKIYVGETKAAEKLGVTRKTFAPQEYVIRFQKNGMILCGFDEESFGDIRYDYDNVLKNTWVPGKFSEVGTLYAVYDFLERFCGIHWINVFDTGTVIPKKQTLSVKGEDVKRKPFFRYRDITPLNYDDAIAMWKDGAPEQLKMLEFAYSNLKAKYPDEKAFNRAKQMKQRLFLVRSRIGGENRNCNHSYYGYYNRFWKKNEDPRRAKHFEGYHPEYFAKGYEGEPPQMCYSNEGLVKQTAKDAKEYFEGKSFTHVAKFQWGKDVFAVVPQDNASYCLCAECDAYRKSHLPGEQLFDFSNRVAREVAKLSPGKRISILAYLDYLYIPSFPLEKNIDVHFCLNSNREPEFSPHYREQISLLKKWAALKDGPPLYLWLYYCFPRETADNGRWYTFPGAFAHVVDRQFKLFHELKLQGMYHCGYGQDVEAYVTNRLMNDPTLDIDTLLDEYFSMYGAAKEPMKKFYRILEETYQNPINYAGFERWYSFVVSWSCLGTDEVMAKLAACMAEAEKLAQTPQEKQAVGIWRKGIWEYMLKGKQIFTDKQKAPIPSLVSPKQKKDAKGDVTKVDWTHSVALDKWYRSNTMDASLRKHSGKITHDNDYLYLELTDPVDPAKLKSSPVVFMVDDWEVFIGRQRGTPYRQYAFNPAELIVALALGEINMLRSAPIEPTGIKVKAIKEKNRWTSQVAFPLSTLVEKPVKPGDTLYFSINRVENPAIEKVNFRNEISTLVPYCSLNDPDRFAELKLAK